MATTSRNAGGFGGPVANPATQDLEGALNRLTAPHVNIPPRSMVGSSAGAYQNPIHPSIMSAGRKRGCANRPSAGALSFDLTCEGVIHYY